MNTFLAGLVTTSHSLLDIELFSIGESSISIGKLVGALLLSVLGYLFAKLFSRELGKRLERRSALPKGASATYQALLFYLLTALSILLALAVVEIPLTIFTLFGGALAIGVGFGSQNLLNNFISGLIILFERPIRVGDIVEIGGGRGTVLEIGARKTRIRQFDGLELLVPNSKFLEQQFSNWTLSDENIRSSLQLALPITTDPKSAQEIMLRTVSEFREVLSQPPVVALLSDIKDGILEFTLHYWISLQDISSRVRLESEIRIALLAHLKEGGMEVATPQREIKMVRNG